MGRQWADVGVSIVSDGWTNVRNQHLINVLGVSSTGAMFLADMTPLQLLHLPKTFQISS
jgi:hypothetical protein